MTVDWIIRDKILLGYISSFKYVDANQLYHLLFYDIKNGKSKAGDRLRSLYKRGELKRKKVLNRYIYYIGGWSDKWKHHYELLNYYIRFRKYLKDWQRLDKYYNEFVISDNLRCDSLFIVTNKVENIQRKYFIEIDRGTNKFDKVKKYNDEFSSNEWTNKWWADLDGEGKARFGEVVVVSCRVDEIEKKIKEENRKGLKFSVIPL